MGHSGSLGAARFHIDGKTFVEWVRHIPFLVSLILLVISAASGSSRPSRAAPFNLRRGPFGALARDPANNFSTAPERMEPRGRHRHSTRIGVEFSPDVFRRRSAQATQSLAFAGNPCDVMSRMRLFSWHSHRELLACVLTPRVQVTGECRYQ
jgi:hypothetical protein